ncbi:hypothetical protein V8C86DRAFT_2480461 [Haematococcus lacustris]
MLVVILVALLAPWGSQAYTYPLVDLPGSTVTCPAPTPYLGPDGRPLDPMSLVVPSLSFLESSGLDRECLGSVMEGLSSCIGDIPIREGCCSAGCATALNTFLSVEGGKCLPQVGAALCRNNEIANMLRPMHFNAYKRCVTGMLLSCADVYQGPPPPPTPSPSLSPSPSPEETSEHSYEHSDEHSGEHSDHPVQLHPVRVHPVGVRPVRVYQVHPVQANNHDNDNEHSHEESDEHSHENSNEHSQ